MINITYCPACAGPASDSTFLGTFGKVLREPSPGFLTDLYKCRRCTHVYNNPQLSAEELEPFYPESYHVFAKGWLSREQIESEIIGFSGDQFRHVPIKKGGHYLDVGCANGDMVALIGALGMHALGVDLSPHAASIAVERGLNVRCCTLVEANFPSINFDAISMFHVLEHIQDPVEILRECFRILKPGGTQVIGVPNSDSQMFKLLGDAWHALDVPRHLQHFNPVSLRTAVERAGFKVTRLTTEALDWAVESELTYWLRRRFLVPQRLTKSLGLVRGLSRRLARKANATGRGEAVLLWATKAVR
jgi:2-polyprenyl-3-methyl-5-hydroxy-6-metoxy-1,4-benzoquinol methylase